MSQFQVGVIVLIATVLICMTAIICTHNEVPVAMGGVLTFCLGVLVPNGSNKGN